HEGGETGQKFRFHGGAVLFEFEKFFHSPVAPLLCRFDISGDHRGGSLWEGSPVLSAYPTKNAAVLHGASRQKQR
ncbi:MAG: hypothetical protein MR374_10160, partial [Clostridia bacterium]|nr:hypothetical protein [Clostridia bacterium]